jgi:Kdo2-lipid IVA lauroyltransferase/acyltransferase
MRLKLLKVFCRLFAILPDRFTGGLAFCLGNFFYYAAPFRKKVIARQVRLTLGRTMTEREIKALIRKNYVHYACVLFESMILFSVDLQRTSYFDRHFTAPHLDLLKQALAEGKGGILIGCHLGFWESIGPYCARNVSPLTVAVKLMKSGFIQSLREEMQAHDNIRLVDSRMGRQRIIAMLHALRKGELVGLFLDQYRPGEDFVTFLGHDARTNSSAATLHRKTGAPVILIHAVRKRFGEYEIDIQRADPPAFPDLTDSRDLTKAATAYFTSRIEEVVRRYPDQWFWAHRRFKDNPAFQY